MESTQEFEQNRSTGLGVASALMAQLLSHAR
jgi:hypothetical protein